MAHEFATKFRYHGKRRLRILTQHLHEASFRNSPEGGSMDSIDVCVIGLDFPMDFELSQEGLETTTDR